MGDRLQRGARGVPAPRRRARISPFSAPSLVPTLSPSFARLFLIPRAPRPVAAVSLVSLGPGRAVGFLSVLPSTCGPTAPFPIWDRTGPVVRLVPVSVRRYGTHLLASRAPRPARFPESRVIGLRSVALVAGGRDSPDASIKAVCWLRLRARSPGRTRVQVNRC